MNRKRRVPRGPVFHTTTAASARSAGFQPAVSRVSNPLDDRLGTTVCRLEVGDTAGWKPALRSFGLHDSRNGNCWHESDGALVVAPASWSAERQFRFPGVRRQGPVRLKLVASESGAPRRTPKPGGAPGRFIGRALPLALLVQSPSLFALSTNYVPGKIPDLRPPQGPLPPTYWEQHGSVIILGALAALVALAVLIWLVRRPKPVVTVSPGVAARQALAALRGQPEDGPRAAAASQHLRSCVQAALQLPPGERTPEELLASVRGDARVSSDLVSRLGALLQECDARAFAPVPPPGQPALVERALGVVAQFEAAGAPVAAPAAGEASQ
jgi:hypothetical protein